MIREDILWSQIYRPKRVDDCILPESIKSTFQEYVNKGQVPNLILSGSKGSGKTTIALAMCEEIGLDYIIINGSDENGIDTFRNKIKNYASSVSLSGGRKVIIIDEADYLNCLDENESIRLGTVENWDSVKLEDLSINKQFPLVSFNIEKCVFENDMGEVVADFEDDIYEVELESGKILRVSKDHPFITLDLDGVCIERTISDGLTDCSVVVFDNIISIKTEKVKSIKYIDKSRVINLQVEKNKTIVSSNGIVTHNCNSIQPALRGAMEEFSKNCSFIFTCNNKNRIIEPLHSRCSVVDFKIPKEEKTKLMFQLFKRVCGILENENITYNKEVISQLIKNYYPDNRRLLNELQTHSVTGSIDVGLLGKVSDIQLTPLFKSLKIKNFTDTRKWLSDNDDLDSTTLYRKIYDTSQEFIKPTSIPELVLLIGRYQYQNAFVADQQINTLAFFIEMMTDLEFL